MYSRSVDISCFINKNNIWNLQMEIVPSYILDHDWVIIINLN